MSDNNPFEPLGNVFNDPLGSAGQTIARTADAFVAGGQGKKHLDKEDARRKGNIKSANNRNSLLKLVAENDIISDVTRNELLLSLRASKSTDSNKIKNIGARFISAQEGIEPIFKSRQNTQALFETLFDQPGRVQTIAASSNRNNRLLG